MTHRQFNGRIIALATVAGLTSHAALASPSTEAELRQSWQSTMARMPVPGEGCFATAYPSTAWSKVPCGVAPKRPYIPRHGTIGGETVGNGKDYAAVTSTITTAAVGTFPTVTGVKSETGYGGAANTYSLQLNSGFMNTAACTGGDASCQSWEQFVYSSSSAAAFMQYWLINYGSKCPDKSWNAYQGSCYKNSAAVPVPQQVITQLASLKVSAAAVSGGLDTMVMTTASTAYSTTGEDSVVDLATAWKASEFNIVGDGGGSAAKFNKGSSVTVDIALKDGATTAPKCVANDGTTGETNNLKLHACSTAAGTEPTVSFAESN